jgi:hypothetical protein
MFNDGLFSWNAQNVEADPLAARGQHSTLPRGHKANRMSETDRQQGAKTLPAPTRLPHRRGGNTVDHVDGRPQQRRVRHTSTGAAAAATEPACRCTRACDQDRVPREHMACCCTAPPGARPGPAATR